MNTPTIYNLAPELERCCKEIEKGMHRGEPVFIQGNDDAVFERLAKEFVDRHDADSHFIKDMNEYRVRQLLKSRVKRIHII